MSYTDNKIIKEIVNGYKKGRSICSLAVEYTMGRRSIANILAKQGVKIRRHGQRSNYAVLKYGMNVGHEEIQRIYELKKQGMPNWKIAHALQRNQTTIQVYLDAADAADDATEESVEEIMNTRIKKIDRKTFYSIKEMIERGMTGAQIQQALGVGSHALTTIRRCASYEDLMAASKRLTLNADRYYRGTKIPKTKTAAKKNHTPQKDRTISSNFYANLYRSRAESDSWDRFNNAIYYLRGLAKTPEEAGKLSFYNVVEPFLIEEYTRIENEYNGGKPFQPPTQDQVRAYKSLVAKNNNTMKKKATDHSEEDGESQQPPPPLFLSLDEAAALMGLWPSFIEEIAKAGKIKSLTYNGTMKVSRSSLEKYFEDLENKINESAIQRDIKALEKID
jgi:hypothetical protein